MPGAAGLRVVGTEKMQTLGGHLRAIGGPEARGLRSNTRKAIVAAVLPVQAKIKAEYLSLPAGQQSTGLRAALAAGTKRSIKMSAKAAVVEIFVDPRTPHNGATLRNLPAYIEGTSRKPWLHPVYADASDPRDQWHWTKTPQASHPTFYPIAREGAADATVATVAAINETLAQLPKVIE